MSDAATVNFVFPSLGESVESATITRWLKSEGESFEADEPLLEVSTDKVDTEVVAPFSGSLVRIEADENAVVSVGETLAILASQGATTPEDRASVPTAPAVQGPMAVDTTAPPIQDPVEVATTAPAVQNTVALVTTAPGAQEPKAAAPLPSLSTAGEARRVKLTPIRRLIGDRMIESLRSSAQLTSVVEVDVTTALRLRDAFRRSGHRISLFPILARATLDALDKFEVFNTTWDEESEELVYHSEVGLGIAVDAPRGLMVPVVPSAQKLRIAELATAIASLAESTREGRIRPAELQGGTFTMTNTGSRGALLDTPILNSPQTAILGTGTTTRRVVPVGEDDAFQARDFLHLSLTYDHRIVDGADAARFLSDIKLRLTDIADTIAQGEPLNSARRVNL